MKVLLSGYYGFGNVGDDAVLEAIIRGLREYEPKIKITALSATPRLTRELEGVDSIDRSGWLMIFVKMLRTNVFISGGGTLFQNVTSNRSFLYYIGLVILAKLMFKKVVVFAQGFGPLRGGFYRFLAKTVLNRVNLITLRDRDSYEKIRKLGVRRPKIFLTGDPSAILKIPRTREGRRILSLEAIRSKNAMLGVAVRSVPRKDEEQLYQSLAEAIDWLSRSYSFTPVFVLFQCPEDMGETSRVINYMQGKSNVIYRMCRPKEMLSLISQFDLLIGMRLHSLIFAAMSSVPMLGISYDPKVEAFMKSIDEPCLKVGEDVNLHNLKMSLQKILTHKAGIKAGLDVKARKLHDQAALNFRLFFEHFRPRRKLHKQKK
jgi:polysaccharide pyruvyl transferase CsaB